MPTPRRARQRHQPLAVEQDRDTRRSRPVSPDERCQLDRQVVAERVERAQRRERRRQIRVNHLPDVLGPPEVLETVPAQVEQGRAGRKAIGDQLRRRRRHQDLTAVPAVADPAATVERRDRRSDAGRGAAPRRCAPRSAPAARHPSGHGSAANACCAATAAATASEARLNAATHAVTFALLDRPDAAMGDDRLIEQLVVSGAATAIAVRCLLPPSRSIPRHRSAGT